MRTFVAVDVDESCRQKLQGAIETLKPVSDGVRWVKPDALHLTLKFIGELKENDLPEATSAIGGAAAQSAPFTMEVAGLSGFPPRGTPKVVFAGAEEPEGILRDLHAGVEDALSRELGVKKENRKFVPHITLGRVKKRGRAPTLEKMQNALADDYFGTVSVSSVVLMKSDLTPQGAVYTALQEFTLGE